MHLSDPYQPTLLPSNCVDTTASTNPGVIARLRRAMRPTYCCTFLLWLVHMTRGRSAISAWVTPVLARQVTQAFNSTDGCASYLALRKSQPL